MHVINLYYGFIEYNNRKYTTTAKTSLTGNYQHNTTLDEKKERKYNITGTHIAACKLVLTVAKAKGNERRWRVKDSTAATKASHGNLCIPHAWQERRVEQGEVQKDTPALSFFVLTWSSGWYGAMLPVPPCTKMETKEKGKGKGKEEEKRKVKEEEEKEG